VRTDNPKKILVADDDADYLYQIQMQLEKFGFEVIAVDSQKEAERTIEMIRPDMAIIDLMMENQDSGFILSYKMKKKYPEIPIIIVTGVALETGLAFDLKSEDSKKWIKADLYIEKGIVAEQLYNEINKLLKL
jgi:two-component system, OmpR family, response regulator